MAQVTNNMFVVAGGPSLLDLKPSPVKERNVCVGVNYTFENKKWRKHLTHHFIRDMPCIIMALEKGVHDKNIMRHGSWYRDPPFNGKAMDTGMLGIWTYYTRFTPRRIYLLGFDFPYEKEHWSSYYNGQSSDHPTKDQQKFSNPLLQAWWRQAWAHLLDEIRGCGTDVCRVGPLLHYISNLFPYAQIEPKDFDMAALQEEDAWK